MPISFVSLIAIDVYNSFTCQVGFKISSLYQVVWITISLLSIITHLLLQHSCGFIFFPPLSYAFILPCTFLLFYIKKLSENFSKSYMFACPKLVPPSQNLRSIKPLSLLTKAFPSNQKPPNVNEKGIGLYSLLSFLCPFIVS